MITSHPSDEALLQMAAGWLAAGPRLVLSTHVSLCARCRTRLRDYETIGGDLLEDADPRILSPDAFAKTLALIDRPIGSEPSLMHGIEPGLPAPLNHYAGSPWRRLNASLSWRRITLPEDPAANVIMLKVAAGRAVPRHAHTGREFTQVISGGFSDAQGHYLPGDCIEADAEIAHQPKGDPDGECVVLASVEGRLRLSSWLGRLVQPLIGL